MYEPQATELLMTLGLSVAEESSPEQGEGAAAAGRIVPLEGVQALSAAMSLLGGDSGVSAEVSSCVLRYAIRCFGGVHAFGYLVVYHACICNIRVKNSGGFCFFLV